MILGEIPNRDKLIEFIAIDEHRPFQVLGDCVEVGTDLGAYFSNFYKISVDEKRKVYGRLFLLDTWDVNHFYKEITQDEMDQRYVSVVSACIQAKDVYPLKGDNHYISRAFQDKSLHFVYIDAQHHYAAVEKDIQTWLPKVAPLGIISGHDFHMPSVRQAVEDVLKPKGIQIYSTWQEEGTTWYAMV